MKKNLRFGFFVLVGVLLLPVGCSTLKNKGFDHEPFAQKSYAYQQAADAEGALTKAEESEVLNYLKEMNSKLERIASSQETQKSAPTPIAVPPQLKKLPPEVFEGKPKVEIVKKADKPVTDCGSNCQSQINQLRKGQQEIALTLEVMSGGKSLLSTIGKEELVEQIMKLNAGEQLPLHFSPFPEAGYEIPKTMVEKFDPLVILEKKGIIKLVKIHGYSDSQGGYKEKNVELSRKRAEAGKDVLILKSLTHLKDLPVYGYGPTDKFGFQSDNRCIVVVIEKL